MGHNFGLDRAVGVGHYSRVVTITIVFSTWSSCSYGYNLAVGVGGSDVGHNFGLNTAVGLRDNCGVVCVA